jgi:antitoxin-like ribbon-helix-helix protein
VAGYFAATRVGKKKLTAAVAPPAHTQFRQLALELGKKGEVLLIEAINDLFSKYGKPPVA